MELQIASKNMEISPTDRSYVEKKITKLAHYLPGITEAKVEIHEENTKAPKHRFTAQATLNSKGILLRGEERGERVRVAVDAVVDVLARQIERYKGKLYDRGRGVSLTRKAADSGAAAANLEAMDWPKIVRVKRFVVKPMSVVEAAEQMELLGHSFFLFVNDNDDALSLLYKRDDGNYGMIAPELD